MEIDREHLHHAYLLIGQPSDGEKFLHSLFPDLVGSPDFFQWKQETFGIDDARELSSLAVRKAFTGRKVILLAPEAITPEAQNALLKTFEEPIPNTHFFLVASDEGIILHTLRSRMRSVRLTSENSISQEAKKFLNASLSERLTLVKKFVDAEKNLSIFLDNVLLAVETPAARKHLYKMRLISDQRGASDRLILEHLAVML